MSTLYDRAAEHGTLQVVDRKIILRHLLVRVARDDVSALPDPLAESPKDALVHVTN